jgi:hypothetical protein
MKFTTFIPTHLNDGTPVSEAELDAIQMELAIQFGGATDEGLVKGMWFDEGGTLYRDTCRKLFVKCDNSRVDEVNGIVKARSTEGSVKRRCGSSWTSATTRRSSTVNKEDTKHGQSQAQQTEAVPRRSSPIAPSRGQFHGILERALRDRRTIESPVSDLIRASRVLQDGRMEKVPRAVA